MRTLATEFLKLRRSRITWATLAAASLGPLLAAFFMLILQNPELARRAGLLNQKAQLLATAADWPSYLAVIRMTAGLFGLLLTGVVAAFVFGREYAEGTAKNMLTLPVRREWFVLAKFGVLAAWMAALTAAALAEAVALGLLLRLPGFDPRLLAASLGSSLLGVGLAVLLAPVFGWAAIAGRGFLPPVGAALLALVLANFLARTGWGRWFPWSVVALALEVGEPRGETLAAGSYVVVAAVSALGLAGAMLHLRRADNTQ